MIELYKKQLIIAFKKDQKMRIDCFKNNQEWDDDVDIKNTNLLLEIVRNIGWPVISVFDITAANAAMCIAIHADKTPIAQNYFLEKTTAVLDDITKSLFANLYDRVNIRNTGYQKYGTQVTLLNGKYVPLPIIDIKNVDKYRKQLGINQSLDEYLSTFADSLKSF